MPLCLRNVLSFNLLTSRDMIKVIYISVACLCLIFLCTNLVTLINIFCDKLWSMYSKDLAWVSFSFVKRVRIRYSNRLICQTTIGISKVWFVFFQRYMVTSKKDEENINWPKFGPLFIVVLHQFHTIQKYQRVHSLRFFCNNLFSSHKK